MNINMNVKKEINLNEVIIGKVKYWVDSRSNMWNANKYTKQQAERHSGNCASCFDCTNIENCISCVNCVNCINCIECVSCVDCTNCISCIKCINCKDCKRCSECIKETSLIEQGSDDSLMITFVFVIIILILVGGLIAMWNLK